MENEAQYTLLCNRGGAVRDRPATNASWKRIHRNSSSTGLGEVPQTHLLLTKQPDGPNGGLLAPPIPLSFVNISLVSLERPLVEKPLLPAG